MFADLGAEQPIAAKQSGHRIVVEVKSFIGKNFIQAFKTAIGQYKIYLFFKRTPPDSKLYTQHGHNLRFLWPS